MHTALICVGAWFASSIPIGLLVGQFFRFNETPTGSGISAHSSLLRHPSPVAATSASGISAPCRAAGASFRVD